MANNQPVSTAVSDAVPATSSADSRAASRVWWWLQAVQVRLRFLIVVLMAAGIVSQWTLLRSVWERAWWQVGGRSAAGAVSAGHEYFCPMDPGVLSTWPAICPICNMDLVPRKKMDAQLLPGGVVARMQLSPYRIQLAGIRTTVVEPRVLREEFHFTGVLASVASGDHEGQRENSETANSATGPLVNARSSSLGFDVNISLSDAAGFIEPRAADVRSLNSNRPAVRATAQLVKSDETPAASIVVPRVRIVLEDTASLAVGSIVTATIAVPARAFLAPQFKDGLSPISETSRSVTDDSRDALSDEVLSVPESSVIDRGLQRLVYVETMPGQFDGVAVEVGRRCGAFYPILKGLKFGQRVATAGAFLIDAETRLNPSLAAGYFGANRSATIPTASPPPAAPATTTSSGGPVSPTKAKPKPTPSLSPADQTLADHQKICPVTELPLNSMGGPVPVMVAGRKVFLCCVGCEARLKAEPQKYLARLPAN